MAQFQAPLPPLLLVSSTPQDAPLVQQLAARLAPRGLALTPSPASQAPFQPAGDLIGRCALFLLVLSPAALASSSLQAEWRAALQRGVAVMPIVRDAHAALPPELKALQWLDFSSSHDEGWRGLLVVLDARGLALFPPPPVPVLDAEVVLARALAGRIPPDWSVNRQYTMARRSVMSDAVFGAAALSIVALLAFMLSGLNLLPLLMGLTLALVYLVAWRSPVLTVLKQGEMIVVTPAGVLLHLRTGTIACSFHDTAAIALASEAPDHSVVLAVTPAGRPPYTLAIGHSFGNAALIAAQIITARRAYLAQYGAYRPAGASGATPAIEPRPSPLVFVSYARRDARFADDIEINLRVRNLRAWVDRSVLAGGQRWHDEIGQAIAACDALVVIISPASMRSPIVRQEYEYALQLGKPVVGILARTTRRIPPALRPHIRADYRRSIIEGLLAFQLALDDFGIRPPAPAGKLRLDPVVVLARARRGQAPAGGRIFTARVPVRALRIAAQPILLGALIVAVLSRALPLPLLLGLYGEVLLGWLLPQGRSILRKLHLPETIVTMSDGAVFLWQSRQITELAYATVANLQATASWGAVRLAFTPTDAIRPLVIALGSHFSNQRQVADEINADYRRYVAAHHPAAVPAAIIVPRR